MNPDMQQYLVPTPTIDSDCPSVQTFARNNAGNDLDPKSQAVCLYYAVRDGIWYDPYRIDLTVDGLKASTTLRTGRSWCIAKAILLAACCRVMNIPARLGFADVKNHLSTARMREQMKTDTFYWHGYTSIYLNGVWLKATPAFNIELCKRFRMMPLEFDGSTDSIFQPFDLDGHQHMEYVNYRGEFLDTPLDAIRKTFHDKYAWNLSCWKDADFDSDVAREV